MTECIPQSPEARCPHCQEECLKDRSGSNPHFSRAFGRPALNELYCRGGPPCPPIRDVHTPSHSMTQPNPARTLSGRAQRPAPTVCREKWGLNQSQYLQLNKINNIGRCGSEILDPVVYARNRGGDPRSAGKSFSDNPLKSAQKRTKNVSARDGVTPSQQRALVALVEARSIVAAARTAGVGESSIRRWLREDERFKTKLRQLREEAGF